jgi:hypothetical protein
MANNGGNEVVAGGHRNFQNKGNRQPGITGIDSWEKLFPSFGNQYNNIEEILKFPDTKDMAGVMARGCFKNERQRVAAVRLAYKNRLFHDAEHQEMLRDYIASSLGEKALGKILQAQLGTNLLIPGVLREILGMKNRKEEQVARGSDFREQPLPQQNNNGGNSQ